MKRIWFNYNDWEDYHSGFYSTKKEEDYELKAEKIKEFFTSKTDFLKTCLELFDKWPNSINFNLSNNTQNRKSYLGQAACCCKFGISAKTTAKVWTELDDDTKNFSNDVADIVISIYEKCYYDKNNINIVRGKNEKLS